MGQNKLFSARQYLKQARQPILGPRGFEDLGRMAVYFWGAGEHYIYSNYFQGFGEKAHSFGDLGSPAKSKKNLNLKEK